MSEKRQFIYVITIITLTLLLILGTIVVITDEGKSDNEMITVNELIKKSLIAESQKPYSSESIITHGSNADGSYYSIETYVKSLNNDRIEYECQSTKDTLWDYVKEQYYVMPNNFMYKRWCDNDMVAMSDWELVDICEPKIKVNYPELTDENTTMNTVNKTKLFDRDVYVHTQVAEDSNWCVAYFKYYDAETWLPIKTEILFTDKRKSSANAEIINTSTTHHYYDTDDYIWLYNEPEEEGLIYE